MRSCAIVLIIAVALLSQEAEAGGKDAKKQHADAGAKSALAKSQPKQPTVTHGDAPKPSSVSAEVEGFDKRLKVTEAKLKEARKIRPKIAKVALKLKADTDAALKAVTAAATSGPQLGETEEVLGTPHSELGETMELPPSFEKLKSAVEADAKHNIWKQEVASDKAALEAEKDAKSVIQDLQSEELGETSILHDGRAWANQEKKQLKKAQKFAAAAHAEHVVQQKAEKDTRKIASMYSKVEASLTKHAKELASADASMKWAQDDVKELGEMSAESGELGKIES